MVSLALSYNSSAGVAQGIHYISARCDREIYAGRPYFHRRDKASSHSSKLVNPQSTLNNVGPLVRQQRSPCLR